MLDITAATAGTFEVRTAEGTDFIVELRSDGDFLTRKPGMSRPTGYPDSSRMEGDFTRLPLIERPAFTVGEVARIVVRVDDEHLTYETTPVTSVSPG